MRRITPRGLFGETVTTEHVLCHTSASVLASAMVVSLPPFSLIDESRSVSLDAVENLLLSREARVESSKPFMGVFMTGKGLRSSVAIPLTCRSPPGWCVWVRGRGRGREGGGEGGKEGEGRRGRGREGGGEGGKEGEGRRGREREGGGEREEGGGEREREGGERGKEGKRERGKEERGGWRG